MHKTQHLIQNAILMVQNTNSAIMSIHYNYKFHITNLHHNRLSL